MTNTTSTTLEAYKLAQKLCNDYERRKKQERELNQKKEKLKPEAVDDPRRTVTEIDYKKHEDTVKELKRQEQEEAYQKKKLEASTWCTLDHEHGPNCRRNVGGCSHDHQKEWAIYEKSTEEKIKAADRFREEGNGAFKKRNYGLAAVHYRKALLFFDYTFAEGDEEEKSLDKVKLPCLLNLAACKCHQEEWDEVLTNCRLALEVNPRSVKAFYRTGLAHLARDQFDLARDALMSAYEIEPQNKEVLGTLERLKNNVQNYKVRSKEVYKQMVAGTAGQENQDREGAAEGAAGDAAEAEGSEAAPADDRPAAVEEPPAAFAAEVVPPPAPFVAAPAAAEPQAEPAAKPLPKPAPAAIVEENSRSAHERAVERTTRRLEEEKIERPAPAEGLRQRRAAPKAPTREEGDDDTDDEDEEVGDDEGATQRRMLNIILLLAGGLAVTSVGICFFAYWVDSGR